MATALVEVMRFEVASEASKWVVIEFAQFFLLQCWASQISESIEKCWIWNVIHFAIMLFFFFFWEVEKIDNVE